MSGGEGGHGPAPILTGSDGGEGGGRQRQVGRPGRQAGHHLQQIEHKYVRVYSTDRKQIFIYDRYTIIQLFIWNRINLVFFLFLHIVPSHSKKTLYFATTFKGRNGGTACNQLQIFTIFFYICPLGERNTVCVYKYIYKGWLFSS